jgi:hypothetical protein
MNQLFKPEASVFAFVGTIRFQNNIYSVILSSAFIIVFRHLQRSKKASKVSFYLSETK